MITNSTQDSLQKSPKHPNGTVSITTHRLFYIDAQKEVSNSFAIDLVCITQTEYYAGLFKSSPKVTCHLTGERPVAGTDEHEIRSESWECEVCAFRNPPGFSPAAARICELCGVPRSSVPQSPPSQAATTSHLSSSLPSSSISLSASLAAESHSGRKQTEIACPACTFLNHALLRECEMCGTDLPRPKGDLQSAPSSRPLTPDLNDDDSPRIIKLSFRKGGDKPFYTVLKSSLKSKAWEVGDDFLLFLCVILIV
jgi:ESCRT-II complex subunit VPS36